MFMANVALAYIAMGDVVMYSYSIHSYGLCILRKVHASGGENIARNEGQNSYGLYRYGLSVMVYTAIAYIVMAYIVIV